MGGAAAITGALRRARPTRAGRCWWPYGFSVLLISVLLVVPSGLTVTLFSFDSTVPGRKECRLMVLPCITKDFPCELCSNAVAPTRTALRSVALGLNFGGLTLNVWA